jgi:hypothetical protein
MKTALKSGVILGLMIVGWTFLMGITGWYKHPTLNFVFGFVALFQIVVLVVTLVRTRAENGYLAQLRIGVVASVIAALFAFAGSILFTTVAFPSYFEDLRQMAREQGVSEAEIAQIAETQTPLFQALAGAIGTTLTGLVVSAIVAVFVRKK